MIYRSQANFARALGISENSVSRKLAGNTGFSQLDIETWAEMLKIKREDYADFFSLSDRG